MKALIAIQFICRLLNILAYNDTNSIDKSDRAFQLEALTTAFHALKRHNHWGRKNA